MQHPCVSCVVIRWRAYVWFFLGVLSLALLCLLLVLRGSFLCNPVSKIFVGTIELLRCSRLVSSLSCIHVCVFLFELHMLLVFDVLSLLPAM